MKVSGHVHVCSVCRFCLFLRFFYLILELFRLFCFSFYYLRINLIRKCENNYLINICIGIIKLIKSTFKQICILFQIYNLPDPMTYFICCTLSKSACVFIVKVIKEHLYSTYYYICNFVMSEMLIFLTHTLNHHAHLGHYKIILIIFLIMLSYFNI